MITKIENSEVDSERISYILTPIENHLNNSDFSNAVVQKPWGYEYLMYQNDYVSIWILYIKPGHLTSMHCHINKKTALLVLSGEAVFTTLEKGFNLKEGDGLVIDKKVFHSTQSISNEGVIVMEIETPSQKTDLLRLSDSYGRESKGYESRDHISQNLSEYEYIFFKENEFRIVKKIKNMNISLERFENEKEIRKYLTTYRNGIGVILNGVLNNLSRGEIFCIESLTNIYDLKVPLEILCVRNSAN